MTIKTPILGLLPEELAEKIGPPKYRADQIFEWLHGKLAASFAEMTNLPKDFRDTLEQTYLITTLNPVSAEKANDGSIKWLFETPRKDAVEAVLIPTESRRTLCISTQVGCKFGCTFCASGQAGFERNLGADEIISEVLSAERLNPFERISHIVIMGMGEPFDNADNLLRALKTLNHPSGRGIGKRRITISTVGIPKKILWFAEQNLPFELSVSLHSAVDSVRTSIMPVNKAFPTKELFEACWKYTEKTNRVITFEYILIGGVNTDETNASALISALKGRKAKVNLIPYNPIDEYPQKRPALETIRGFEQKLIRAGIPATVRFSKGSSVNGACGQLRLRHIEKKQ
ncbi:MAG: 23S rRNA (adenine(2503)-C(2))-methyltransferase RlmN [Candidatus Omnitrophica bacterium]|nr:23S rRNA (adenine(2503)-C(2))-methyltransferase RlmN [Candidatus Omnitrophota bacterium]